jgi:hypothetical protein
MQKVIFILLFIFSHAIADEWTTIVPLPHCKKFKVQFQFDGKYHIRYQKRPYTDYITFPKTLMSINDLSELTDELVEVSYNYCPMTISLTEVDGKITCAEEELAAKPFSSDYTALLQLMISAVDRAGNNCKDVIPLITLQNEISQLDQHQVLRFNKSINVLKILTGNKTDVLIDHYYACGGQKGSRQFIENLILIEAKNACLYPSPPGILTFEAAREVAQTVAKKYQNSGLLSLNKKKNSILKDTVNQFVKAGLKQQVTAIFGNEFNSEKFVTGLDITKNMKKIPGEKIQDYAAYVLSVDAPLEIIDKGLPNLIEKNFSGMLPQKMSRAEKSRYLKNDITERIKKDYNSCMYKYKKRIDYPTKKSNKELVKHRKKLEKQFCKTNPKECKKGGCNKTKNFATTRSDIKDKNMIQACLFKGITLAIKPILSKIVLSQKEEFKDKFPMTTKTAQAISDDAYKNIYMCADKKIKGIANKNYKSGFTSNVEALYHVDSKQYTQSLLECSKKTEEDLTKLFAKMMITNMEVVNKAYKGKREVKIYDQIYNQKAYSFAHKASTKALDKCLGAQRKRVTATNTSAISCQPIIEMEAGKGIISNALTSTLKGANVTESRRNQVINQFNSCADKAIKTGTESMFNHKSKNPIMGPDDAKNYLNKNHDFHNCITASINIVSKDVTEQSLNDMELKLASKIKDPQYFRKLKPILKKKVSDCFDKKMAGINSWGHFQYFNKKKGLEKLKKKCTEIATDYALPKIIINETEHQLLPVADSKISDISLTLISQQLKDQYKIRLPLKTIRDSEKIILTAYKKYMKANPDKKVDDFVKSYSQTAQDATIGSIRVSILENVIQKSKPGFDFSDLGEALPTSCLNFIYSDQKYNLKNLITMIKDRPKPVLEPKKNLQDLFTNMVQKGLIWSKQQGRYPEFVEKIKDVCQNPKKYKDLKEFAKVGIADDIMMGIIEKKVKEGLTSIAQTQCYDELEKQKIVLPANTEEQLCSQDLMNSKDFHSFKDRLLNNAKSPEERAILSFTLLRKRNFLQQIRYDLNRKKLESLFYNDRSTLDYIYKNFDKVASKDPDAIDQIKKISAAKLFEDRSLGSFANKFAKNQIIAAIGISGLPEGKSAVKAKTENLGMIKGLFADTIKPEAKKEFFSRWNYSGVSHYLNWDKTPESKQKELITELIESNINPRLDRDTTEKERDSKKQTMVVMVKDHVKNYKTFKNPKYRSKLIGRAKASQKMKGIKEKLSFVEMMSYDINTGVKDTIIDNVLESINPFSSEEKEKENKSSPLPDQELIIYGP